MSGLSRYRWFVATLVAAVLFAVAVACTTTRADDTDVSPSPSGPSDPTPSPDPVTLRFSVYGDPGRVAAYTDLAKAFTKNYPYATIKVESAETAEASITRLQAQFAAQNPPDLFIAERDSLVGLVSDGMVQPVDVLLEERAVDFGDGYFREGLEAFSAGSALQCMPHDVSSDVVYYNTKLLNLTRLVEPGEAPPTAEDGWTWEQFAQAAHRMSRGKVNGVHIEPGLEALAPFIWSARGELVDDVEAPTSLALAEANAREAIDMVLDLVRSPGVAPTEAQLAKQSAVTRFEKGRLAMIIGTRGLTPELRRAPGLDFEVFPLPQIDRFRTIASMTGYCISAGTENVEAAADFLEFAVGREGATITATAGYVVPSNLQVANSPAFDQPGRQPHNDLAFTDGVRRSDPTPFVAEWPRVLATTAPTLGRLFYAPVIDVDTALEGIDLRSQAIFAPEETAEE